MKAREYLEQEVMYGGMHCCIGDVIIDLENMQCTPEQIHYYLVGLERQLKGGGKDDQ